MITKLRGVIISNHDSKLALYPDGIGIAYEVLVPSLLLEQYSPGGVVELWIHHHRTEMSEVLFGFSTLQSRELFRNLLKVDSVGGRTALNLLSLGDERLLQAIEAGDEVFLSQAPGVGKKTALKILVSMRSFLPKEVLASPSHIQVSQTLTQGQKDPIADTLTAMGYDRKKVLSVLGNLPPEMNSLESQVKWAIRELS